MNRVAFGNIHAHGVTFDEAVALIVDRAAHRQGGYVVTPNVDHVVLAETDADLRASYRDAFLAVADGMPLLWIARLCRSPLPAKISGSDLTVPLVTAAAAAGVSVFLLGASPETCESAIEAMTRQCPSLHVAGHASPDFTVDGDDRPVLEACGRARDSGAGLVLVAMGCPKQEVLMHRFHSYFDGAVAIGIGGTLRFLAGEVDRCPPWMARTGMEWLYRLAKEPRRLARRYLVRDRAIAGIAWRQWRASRRLPERLGNEQVDPS